MNKSSCTIYTLLQDRIKDQTINYRITNLRWVLSPGERSSEEELTV